MVYARRFTLLVYFDGKFVKENMSMKYIDGDLALYDVENIDLLGLIERVVSDEFGVASTKKRHC